MGNSAFFIKGAALLSMAVQKRPPQLGLGLTFDVIAWRQGTLALEIVSPQPGRHHHVLLFHSPYRSYRKHIPPMRETTVDVTEQANTLLSGMTTPTSANEEQTLLRLMGRDALMAFRREAPIVESIFLLSDAAVAAVKPIPVGPWLSQGTKQTRSQQGGAHGRGVGVVWPPC